jgi:DHA1 family bicyclomycin/chloramphenicol resistance-like MFS transporter
MSEVNFSNNQKKSTSLILILGAITTIGPLAIDMYLPAFTAIAESLNASESLVQLSLTSYFIGIIFGQILYGPIVDRFGKKLPLFLGLSLFILASILCCFVHNIHELIFLSFFQAIGACASVIIPRALVRDIFLPQDSARVFSHVMSVMGLAPI